MLTSFTKKISNWLKHKGLDLLFSAILLIVSSFVALKNFVPGSWLLGWDDLVPELNFKLNIGRSLGAAWQEYQGLGLLGGMSHAADLPRQVFLWLSSFVLPVSDIRYFWTFLMLAIGPLGIYFLYISLMGPAARQPQIHPQGDTPALGLPVSRHPLAKISAFAAAIFYLFNLATVQTFFTPFETFVSFYGFLPWLIFFASSYLKTGKKKDLITYLIVSVLAASAFYVQTLFMVYAVIISVFALETIIRLKKKGFFRSLILGMGTIFINAFWLFPVIYFSLVGAQIPVNSHINSIATPETQQMNLARSGIENVAAFKGYWLDYYDWNSNGTYQLMYKDWTAYLNSPHISQISIALFFIGASGLAISIFKKKSYFSATFLAITGISFFFLNGGSLGFIPFFGEIFRNSFTKWINVLSFSISVGIGFFVFAISDFVKNKIKYLIQIFLSAAIIASSVYITLPIVNGGLIDKSMEVNLPSYYIDTINYFKNIDPSKRIADFPLTDFWGWQFDDWGYRGSGFLWYGVPQPILSRTFDVWSPNNEEFYTEISHAVTSLNSGELKYVLNKFEVSYILFDSSIYIPGNPDSPDIITSQKNFLDSQNFISKEKEFGQIAIYKVNLNNNPDLFISSPKETFTGPYIKPGDVLAAPFISENFPDSQGFSSAKNCSLDGTGSVVKTKKDGGNFYAAYDNGVSCDYFYYPTLDSSIAYAMKIKGINLSGRSLKFYLFNVDTKMVVSEYLLPAGNFDKTYYILPIEKTHGGGYTLNVETRSFGKEKSENLLTGIGFYPVSFSISKPQPSQNNLKVLGTEKLVPWFYEVQVSGFGTLELGQGYDSGWVAVQLPINNLQFSILKHEKFDGWANAWGVQSSGSVNQSIGSTVYVIYLPQFLEIGGILVALVYLLILFVRK